MSFWNRPLHAMTDSFTFAGFRISIISEPLPDEKGRDVEEPELPVLRPGTPVALVQGESSAAIPK
jgi:hypothetical protein